MKKSSTGIQYPSEELSQLTHDLLAADAAGLLKAYPFFSMGLPSAEPVARRSGLRKTDLRRSPHLMASSKLVIRKNLRYIHDKIVVLAHGCYDICTVAHLRHLEWARAQGDCLVVSVTSDTHVARHKGEGRPHFNHDARASFLAGLNVVDHVVVCRADSALGIIEDLQPNIYVKGHDTIGNPGDHFASEIQLVESYGGKVLYSPSDSTGHTSEVRAKILRQE